MNSKKYFCKICKRQCNDKDGFICHLNSNWHKKNNEIYMKNPEAYIEKDSNELKYGFLDVLKRKDDNNYYSLKQLYSEYIRIRDNIGLNSTKWDNLKEFAKDLENEKLVVLNEKNGEIFLKFNNLIKEKKMKEKKKLTNIERVNKEIEKIIENNNKKLKTNTTQKILFKEKPDTPNKSKIEISLNLNQNFLGKKRK